MRILKKSVGILLPAVMTAGMFTALPFTANAASGVQYVDRTWDSTEAKIVETAKSRSDCTALNSGTTEFSGGWYVLNSNVKFSKEIKVSGDASLILCNGYTLDSRYGIFVEQGKTLTIYGQSGDKGKIDVYNKYGAGIGAWDGQKGGSVVIKGGNIKTEGGSKDAGIGGAKGGDSGFDGIAVYGGDITAVSGGRAAAIGSGQRNKKENCGEINIYGGKITAVGNHYGAGIGGGEDCNGGTVTIYGGTIIAEGGHEAAGIGGGEDSHVGNLTINGGTIDAIGGKRAAGIGSGADCLNGGTITINGGKVRAWGSGKNKYSYFGNGAAGIGGGDEGRNGTVTINGGDVEAYASHAAAGIGGGFYYNGGNITITGGYVKARGSEEGAAIGGGKSANAGNITITGGTVKAIGGKDSAAIGAGYHHDLDSEINISNATVYAVSQLGAAIGAGSGDRENHSGENNKPIRITDSKIYAASGRYTDHLFTEETINDYDFDSLTKDKIFNLKQSKNGAAAIGAGQGGSQDGTIYISGSSEVYAYGGGTNKPGAGIGGGGESKLDNGGGSSDIDLSGLTTGFVDSYGAKGSKGKGDAIGAGAGDSRRGTLSIPDNYCVYCYDSNSYAASGKRSSVCQKNRHVLVKPCEHPDDQAYYTLEEDTKEQEHTKHCNLCLYSGTESHSGSPCVCGVENGTCYVTLRSGGVARALVPIGSKFILPDGSDYTGGDYYQLFDGWVYNGQILQPGDSITPQSNITVNSHTVEAFDVIAAANLENGTVSADKSIAAVGETVFVDPEPDADHSVSSVTVSGTVYDENNQPSQYSETLTRNEDDEYSFVMPRGNVTVSAAFVYDAHEHDGIAFSPAADTSALSTAGSYFLTADTELPSTLAAGTTNICLNGHTLYIGNSGVVLGQGVTLNIYDDQGTGRITASEDSGEPTDSAAITVDDGGVLNLCSGSITGFSAETSGFGGAVRVCSGGEFNMYEGSSVRKNSFRNNGGVFVQDGGIFRLCGNAEVSNNTNNYGGSENEVNVLLDSNAHIDVAAKLDCVAAVGVRTLSTADFVAVTEGLNGNGSADYFFSDDDEMLVFTGSNGEAILSKFGDETGVHLAGHSISLDGDIAVNFYMQLSSETASHEGVKMQFNVSDTSMEYRNQEVAVSDDIKDGEYYVFKCRVAAKNVDSVIQAQLIDGNSKSRVYTYSVREYANYLLDNADENGTDEQKEYAKAAPLVRAMLAYADNANHYFGGGTEPAQIDAVIPEYAYTVADTAKDVFYGATLSLKSQTTLSLYFASAQELTFSIEGITEGKDYFIDHFGSDYVIRIRNIAVYDLDKPVTVKVNGEDAVTYSPLTYCYKAQTSSDTKLVNTVRALYNYYLAAHEYF